MIIGVTGGFCSGKDTLAEFLEKKSFYHVSLSDIIREEIRRRGEKVTLAATIKVGNELRSRYGSQVLAQRALQIMDTYKNYVVTSIRHPAEIEMLKTRKDFVLVYVDAGRKKRFERSLARNRRGDFSDFKDFSEAEDKQMEGTDPAAQNLKACKEAADRVIRNDSTLETFRDKIIRMLREVFAEQSSRRPTWDEYFMNVAQVAASRSNCLKRHIGAIIVRDKQIISTGYNGTPKGIKNCNEGGCPRCSDFADSGSRLGECICVHAEENAIVQAACHGTAIKDATLYTTFCPCSYCAKSIINAGIKEVVYRDAYAMDEVTHRLFEEAGIKLRGHPT